MITEHVSEWLGLPVEDYDPAGPPPDYRGTIYRIACSWDNETPLLDQFAQFLEAPESAATPALVIGLFGTESESSQAIIEALVASRQRLPHLRGIFLGDILSEENEISWIEQSDVSPLLAAYPQLEHFRVRGANQLSFGRPRHAHLRTLVVESGGLPAGVVQDVLASALPALEHLELWLGTENYGWSGTVETLAPLLNGDLFPQLQTLALRDSEIADDIAMRLATAPILQRLKTLDLSLGTLSDIGGKALLASAQVRQLQRLDLHRHYLSDAMVKAFEESGLNVDVSEQEDPEESVDDRYVAVSE